MTIRTSAEGSTTLLGGPPERPRSRLLLAVIAVVAVATGLVVAANQLGGDDGEVATTATQEPSAAPAAPVTTPSDPQAARKAAVIEAYKQSYLALIIVGKEVAPNLDDPRLSQHTTGPALIASQRALADHKSKGLIYSGDAELHPTVIELNSDTATVVDCSYDRTGLVDARTGRTVVDAGPPEAGASTAKLRLEGGVWKVTDFKDEKRSCVPPAA